MGIDIRDKLLVGASFEELQPFFKKIIDLGETDEHYALDDESEIIEQYFDYISPYYDSPVEEWFIGFQIKNESLVDDLIFHQIKAQADKFEELTGVAASLKGGAHVY